MEGSPLVIGQLLLHQEQVGLQLVPLLQDLLQLFHGEAALSRAPALILARRLLRRQRCRSFLGIDSVRAQRSPQSRAPAAPGPPTAHLAGLRQRCLGGSPAPPAHFPLGLQHSGLQVRFLLQGALELRLHHGHFVPQLLVHGHEAVQLLLQLERRRQPAVRYSSTAWPPPRTSAQRGNGICPSGITSGAINPRGGDMKAGPRALTASVSWLLQTISCAWARSSSLCLSTTSFSRSITSRSFRTVLSVPGMGEWTSLGRPSPSPSCHLPGSQLVPKIFRPKTYGSLGEPVACRRQHWRWWEGALSSPYTHLPGGGSPPAAPGAAGSAPPAGPGGRAGLAPGARPPTASAPGPGGRGQLGQGQAWGLATAWSEPPKE